MRTFSNLFEDVNDWSESSGGFGEYFVQPGLFSGVGGLVSFLQKRGMAALKENSSLAENPKELLTHIIRVAKSAGFSFRNFLDDYDSFIITSFNPDTGRMVFVLRNEQELKVVYDSIYTLFFDLSFARALFGEDWEPHLIGLAQSSNKLQYLSKNIIIPVNNDNSQPNSSRIIKLS